MWKIPNPNPNPNHLKRPYKKLCRGPWPHKTCLCVSVGTDRSTSSPVDPVVSIYISLSWYCNFVLHESGGLALKRKWVKCFTITAVFFNLKVNRNPNCHIIWPHITLLCLSYLGHSTADIPRRTVTMARTRHFTFKGGCYAGHPLPPFFLIKKEKKRKEEVTLGIGKLVGM